MALNIKNAEVERLATEVAVVTGETKTEAIRKALEERSRRLYFQVSRRQRAQGFLRFLEEEVWPNLPPGVLGRRPTRDEEDEILGYGPEGV
ncbi:MAG TPA: type II toxin-antitoxin system VapB family antitoxin [Thermoanaerobaculia bacterium]|jgi:antitoxin VapB